MLPYLYNKQAAWNPRLGERFWGHAVLPGLTAVRVDPGENPRACLTQVIESPWTEDDAGIPIDVDNVWAVRTRCGAEIDGGEIEWWTFVPRQLPEGYTPVGRCGRIVPLIADHLGDDPMQGVVTLDGFTYSTRPVRWRTKTGQYPPDLEDEGYLWVPMNLNQQTIVQHLTPPYGGMSLWDYETGVPALSIPGWTNPYTGFSHPPESSTTRTTGAILMGSPHIGFRGGALELEWGSSNYNEFYNEPWKKLVRVRLGYSDSPKSAPDEPDTIGTEVEFDESDMVYQGWQHRPDEGGSEYFHVWSLRIELDAMLPPGPERKYFMFLHREQSVGPGNPSLFTTARIHWSPRHDVPLWYWASTRNRVAPGGIKIP